MASELFTFKVEEMVIEPPMVEGRLTKVSPIETETLPLRVQTEVAFGQSGVVAVWGGPTEGGRAIRNLTSLREEDERLYSRAGFAWRAAELSDFAQIRRESGQTAAQLMGSGPGPTWKSRIV